MRTPEFIYSLQSYVPDVKKGAARIAGAAAIIASAYLLPIIEESRATGSSLNRSPVTRSLDRGGIAWADSCPNLPWGNGKYQTFPRLVDGAGNIIALQQIDLGTLGPDVDTIAGLDFEGDLPTGFLVIHQPAGPVFETRIVFNKRTDMETIQFQPAIGGDRFDVWQISKFGGDVCLDASMRLHAQNTARRHQKVVIIGDIGSAQRQFPNEAPFFNRIIRAQRPSQLGIPESNFVNPREFSK